MSAREWTVDELERVHPLPKGWSWQYECDSWWAVSDNDEDRACFIWPHNQARYGNTAGTLTCSGNVPVDVAIAVGLASKGLDSLEAMATASYQRGRSHERIDIVDFVTNPPGRIPEWVRGQIAELAEAIVLAVHEGWGKRLYDTAETFRRGKVEP